MAVSQHLGWCLPLLALAGTFWCAQAALEWKDCGDTSDRLVKVKNITMLPDPAVSGKEFTLSIPAISEKALTGGTVTVKVFLFGFPIHTESDSLCKKTACPVGPGEFSLTNTQSLPWITPAGTYKVQLTALDDSGGQLFCEDIDFKIVRPAPVADELAALLERHVGSTGAAAARRAWGAAFGGVGPWGERLRAAAAHLPGSVGTWAERLRAAAAEYQRRAGRQPGDEGL